MVKRAKDEQEILDNIMSCLSYKKLKQKDLCDYLGISSQAFTNWKNGNTNSYLKYLNKISEFLDVPMEQLLGREPIRSSSELENKLLRLFSLCDTEGKLRIIQIAMNEFDRTEQNKE